MRRSSDQQRRLKLGIIGAGSVVKYLHGPALKFVPEIEVVAIADPNPLVLHQVADQFGIAHRYPDHLCLLKHPELEAVAVCSPTALHPEIAIAVLESRKHLFLEKPIAENLQEANRLVELAKQSNLKVLMGFNLRFHPLLQKARQWIQSGKIGSPTLIHSTFTIAGRRNKLPDWKLLRKGGGGSLFELAGHHFDIWSFLCQSSVQTISALSDGDLNWEDRRVTLTAQLSNGVLVTAAFTQGGNCDGSIKVCGNAGCLDCSYFHWDSLMLTPKGRNVARRQHRLQHFIALAQQLPHNLAKSGTQYYFRSFQSQWHHFAEVILTDTPVQCTLEDGQRALKVVVAALKSIETGQKVAVDDISIGREN